MQFRLRGRNPSALAAAVDRVFTQPETLEKRELMSFSAHVNFQPATAQVPSGYVVDSGKTYASRNGLTYGWSSDNQSTTRNRDSSKSKDQRYDTLAHMQLSGSKSWDIAVPNGTYSVHIVAGDAGYYDSAFRINAEGQLTVSGNPTSTSRWVEGTTTVTVGDGNLTISNASGASNNKIDFIDITQTSTSTSGGTSTSGTTDPSKPYPPLSPTNLSVSSASSTSLNLSWSDNTNRELGYKVERSTDGSNFSQIATISGSATSYTDSGLSSGTKYYYRVRAYNEFGNSSYTNTASATTGSTSSSGGSTSTNTSAPAAPSGLVAQSTSSSSIKIAWSDNSVREDGYKIYRSTDGSSYSQIATVGASVTSYTDSGLSSGTKYYYKVCAYNAYASSSYTNSAYATTGSSTSGGTSSPSETPTSGYFDGVFVGSGEDPNVIIPILRDLGAKAVRLWGSFSDWNNRTEPRSFQRAREYKAAGFKVDLLLQNPNVPSYSQAKAYFDWAKSRSGMTSAVDFWEIQNEPNLSQYWEGSLSQYVNNVLKAAWDSLHTAGEKVVGAGLTASRSSNQSMKDAGYLNYVDYANIHPYDGNATGQRQTISDIKAMFSGKPLMITEWGLQTSGTTSWADQLDENHPYVMANTSAAFYFPLVMTNTPAGGEGLLTTSLAKHNPFYDMYKSWHS